MRADYEYTGTITPLDHRCAWCQETGDTTIIDIHHVLPRGRRPDLVHDPTNQLNLCRRCHDQMEPPGPYHLEVHGDRLHWVNKEGESLGDRPLEAVNMNWGTHPPMSSIANAISIATEESLADLYVREDGRRGLAFLTQAAVCRQYQKRGARDGWDEAAKNYLANQGISIKRSTIYSYALTWQRLAEEAVEDFAEMNDRCDRLSRFPRSVLEKIATVEDTEEALDKAEELIASGASANKVLAEIMGGGETKRRCCIEERLVPVSTVRALGHRVRPPLEIEEGP